MLRRSLMLLACIVFATLWIPDQRTDAQTDCPEGSCKIFLPLVTMPEYVRLKFWRHEVSDRYCANPHIAVYVENVGQELVTGFRVSGHVMSEGSRIDFDSLFPNEAIYPGESSSVQLPLTDICEGIDSDSFQISDVVVKHTRLYALSTLSTSVDVRTDCVGQTHVTVSGEVRNDTSIRLTNIVVEFEYHGSGTATRTTLEPGESMFYQGSFTEFGDLAGQCYPPYYPVTVKAYGEPAP